MADDWSSPTVVRQNLKFSKIVGFEVAGVKRVSSEALPRFAPGEGSREIKKTIMLSVEVLPLPWPSLIQEQ